MPSSCVTPERLRQLSHNELSPSDLERLEEHLSQCGKCRQEMEEVSGLSNWPQDVREALAEVPAMDASALWPSPSSDEGWCDANGSLAPLMTLLGPTDDPRMLGRIGPYEIVGILGHGGMGVVFKGFDVPLNRYVAIKMLLPHLATSGAARKRFAREAQAAAAVVDDHVMAIHCVAEWQGVPYLVMPYGRGESLQKRIEREGPLTVKEILRIGMQTATGLAAAHAQGLVHRDIKPANILLAEGVERVSITDFGLARAVDDASVTRQGTLAGTPQYMSPEQARGAAVDSRSDLFSLGSVLYAMCTGRAPFRADSSYGILRQVTDNEPTPIREIHPEIPQWLCAIVTRLMSKRPEDRFASAAEVAAVLEGCLAHIQHPDTHPLPKRLLGNDAPLMQRIWQCLDWRVLAIVAMLALGLISLCTYLAASLPDISGEWRGEGWGRVVLKPVEGGTYSGTFSAVVGQAPGSLRVKWSWIERRFNGTWQDGEERFGNLSLRVVGKEIRGAWTTDSKSKVHPATPALAEFTWVRPGSEPSRPSPAAGVSTPQEALQDGLLGRTPEINAFPQLGGIGVAVAQHEGRIVVGAVLPNTPADRSGRLKPGDVIVRIEDGARSLDESQNPEQWNLNRVVEFLRGPAQTPVKLFVIPAGENADEKFELTLIRERIALIEPGDFEQQRSDGAANPQTVPPTAGSDTGTIEGMLLDPSGGPVAGATVACSPVSNERGGGANAVTDESGRYRLMGLSPGIYNVWLDRYDVQPDLTAIAEDGILVHAGRTARSRLILVPGSLVQGRVLDPQGNPAAGRRIACYSSARPFSSAAVQATTTDEDGTFEFLLPPGRAHLYVMHDGLQGDPLTDSKTLTIPDAGTVSPITLTLRPLERRLGAADWLDRTTPGTAVRHNAASRDIRGVVSDPQGRPISGALVIRNGPFKTAITTGDSGQFTILLTESQQLILNVFAEGYHVWHGEPSSGDLLQIVLEPKEQKVMLSQPPGGQADRLQLRTAAQSLSRGDRNEQGPSGQPARKSESQPDNAYSQGARMASERPPGHPAECEWGDPRAGLRLGVVWSPEFRAIAKHDKSLEVVAELYIQNVSDKPVRFQACSDPRFGTSVMAIYGPNQKRMVEYPKERLFERTTNRYWLEPQAYTKIKTVRFWLACLNEEPADAPEVEAVLRLPAGRYVLRISEQLPGIETLDDKGRSITPGGGEWTGKLYSAGYPLTIGGPTGREQKRGSGDHPAGMKNVGIGDWPEWGGSPLRNNVAWGQQLPTRWNVDTGLHVRWSAPLGSRTYSSPVIANGKVFIGTNNAHGRLPQIPATTDAACLLCLDEVSGKLLWQYTSGKLPAGETEDYPLVGLCSTPCCRDSRVWCVTNRAEVVCLDTEGFRNGNDGPVTNEALVGPEHGDVVWSLDLRDRFGVKSYHAPCCSVTVVDGRLFVVVSQRAKAWQSPKTGPVVPSFLCLDANTGEVLWRDDIATPNILEGQWSSPCVFELEGQTQAVMPGGDGWIYSFAAAGDGQGQSQLLWKFDTNAKTATLERGQANKRLYPMAAPVFHERLLYVTVGCNPERGEGVGHLFCLDPHKRGDVSAEIASDAQDQPFPRPQPVQATDPKRGEKAVPNPNSAVVWHYSTLDRNRDGRIDFDETFHRTIGSPAIADGLLVVADGSGLVHCLDARTTGQGSPVVHWTHDMQANCWATPLIADGRVLICSEDAKAVIFKLERAKTIVAAHDAGRRIYATPALANHMLYVATSERLFAISAKERPIHAKSDNAPRFPQEPSPLQTKEF